MKEINIKVKEFDGCLGPASQEHISCSPRTLFSGLRGTMRELNINVQNSDGCLGPAPQRLIAKCNQLSLSYRPLQIYRVMATHLTHILSDDDDDDGLNTGPRQEPAEGLWPLAQGAKVCNSRSGRGLMAIGAGRKSV